MADVKVEDPVAEPQEARPAEEEGNEEVGSYCNTSKGMTLKKERKI